MAKKIGLVLGVVFLFIGILGFVGTPIVGAEGILLTNTLLALVYVISGLIFIIVTLKATDSLGVVFKVFGMLYLIVAILGFFVIGDSGTGMILGLIDVNGAGNIFHVILGVLILILSFKVGKGSRMSTGMPIGGMPQ